MRGSILVFISIAIMLGGAEGQQTRLENLRHKTVLVFTPHPDDDVQHHQDRNGSGGAVCGP